MGETAITLYSVEDPQGDCIRLRVEGPNGFTDTFDLTDADSMAYLGEVVYWWFRGRLAEDTITGLW